MWIRLLSRQDYYINNKLILHLQLGSTAIGIQTSEGVVLAVEKRITSPLMEPTSVEKIVEIDSHIGNVCMHSIRSKVKHAFCSCLINSVL